MKPEYHNVRFGISIDVDDSPSSFGIVTAYNPNGVVQEEPRNEKANDKLLSKIHKLDWSGFNVTGCSPDRTHKEPGYGVVTDSINKLIELGREFEQEAVYFVRNNRVLLISCENEEEVEIGEWKSLASHEGYHNYSFLSSSDARKKYGNSMSHIGRRKK